MTNTRERHSRAARALILTGIIVFAVVSRACLNNSGVEGRVLDRNDETHYVEPVLASLNGQYSLRYFINPSLEIHLLQGAVAAAGVFQVVTGTFDSFSDYSLTLTLDPGLIYLIGRVLSVVMAVVGVLLIYAIGARTFSPRVGIVAAAALASNLVHTARSVIVGNEVLMVAAGLAFLWTALRYLDRPTATRHAVAGIALGIAISAKYNAGVLGIGLIIVTLTALRQRAATVTPISPRFWCGFLFVVLGFFATSPWALVHFSDFLSDFRTQADYLHEGWVDHDASKGRGFAYYLTTFPISNNGLPFAIVCGAGLLAALWTGVRRRNPALTLVSVTPLVTYLYLGTGVFHYDRFLLPVIPLILLCGAWILDASLRRIGAGHPAALAFCSMALLLPGARATWSHVHGTFCEDDTRRDLIVYVDEHVSADERWVELTLPAMFRMVGNHDSLRHLAKDAVREPRQQERIDEFRANTPHAPRLQPLLRRSSTFEEFQAEIARIGYQKMLISVPAKYAAAIALLPTYEHDPALRECTYWDELLVWLAQQERSDTVVSHDGRQVLVTFTLR